MDEFVELIDLTSGNVVGDFDDVESALVALQRVAEQHGRNAIENLSLMRIEDDEQSLIAMESELAVMVDESSRVGPGLTTSLRNETRQKHAV